MREYRVMLEPDAAGGFIVWVPALPGCASQGDSEEEALANIREAIQCWIESAEKHGEQVPDDAAVSEWTVAIAV